MRSDTTEWLQNVAAYAQQSKRAAAYVKAAPPAVSGETGHNVTFTVARELVRNIGLTVSEAEPWLQQYNVTKCSPPWTEAELKHKLDDAARTPPSQRVRSTAVEPPPPTPEPLQYRDAWAAIANPAPMAEVIIEGLLRRGETGNIIGATKVAKSWLAMQLLLAGATGGEWLGLRCNRGPCLLIDNELADPTIQNRLHWSARAAEITSGADLKYVSLRGDWRDFPSLASTLIHDWQPGQLQLIVLDAKYRFFGGELDENSNAAQTAFANQTDRLASALQCAIVTVHHTTKGGQAEKSVTDMGAGGGAQSRAVDAHMVIRPHPINPIDLCVFEAAVRSFPRFTPRVIRWGWPLWSHESGIEPSVTKPSEADEKYRMLKDVLTPEWQTLNRLASAVDSNLKNKCFVQAARMLVSDGFAQRTENFRAHRHPEGCPALRLKTDPDAPPSVDCQPPEPEPPKKAAKKAAKAKAKGGK
jgi:hypothetical protein